MQTYHPQLLVAIRTVCFGRPLRRLPTKKLLRRILGACARDTRENAKAQ